MNNTAMPASRHLWPFKAVLAPLWLAGFCQLAQAQTSNQIESSWFEIELLAFSREPQQRLLEQFPDKVRPINTATALDLLSRHYQPDLTPLLLALPACQGEVDNTVLWGQGLQLRMEDSTGDGFLLPALTNLPNDAEQLAFAGLPLQTSFSSALPRDINSPYAMTRLPVFCQYEQLSANWQQPQLTVSVAYKSQPAASLQLPITPPGEEQHQTGPYLAAETALQLKDLAYQLKHRAGHQLLLHTVWRQTLTTKAKSRSSRWFAGRNFAAQFDYAGRPLNLQLPTDAGSALDQQIQQLEQQLQQARKPDLASPALPASAVGSAAVWQLDGLLKVYSDRMLFAEAEFNLRRLSNDGQQLQTFYSQDQTRLLLGEIHYLDHPYLGLVLQIRRFVPPMLPAAVTP
jgi:hypothetical protein